VLDGVRWILFDAVGTLIYPNPPVAEAYHRVARDFQSQLTVAEIKQRFAAAFASEFHRGPGLDRPLTSEAAECERWGRVVAAVLDDVPHAAGEPFERLWQHFAQPSSWRLFDDVPAALSALAARGFRLGIASNFDNRLHRIVAGHAALGACERVFVSSEIGYSKPDRRFFGEIEKTVAVRRILLVGDDRVNDFVGATNAGWRALLIERESGAASPGRLQSLRQLVS
jgi:putative hydrolase of the HAD superfamily